MTLVELIDKHRTELALPDEAFQTDEKHAESMKLYGGFSQDLIVMSDFPFTVDQMEEVGRFLINNGFQYQANAQIAGRIIRRKTFDCVIDIERRARVWLAFSFDRNPFETASLKEAIEYAGREQIVADIRGIEVAYNKVIYPELAKFSKRHMEAREENGENSPESKFYNNIVERFYNSASNGKGYAMYLRGSLEKEDLERQREEVYQRAIRKLRGEEK